MGFRFVQKMGDPPPPYEFVAGKNELLNLKPLDIWEPIF
jgi:hypothetical protein